MTLLETLCIFVDKRPGLNFNDYGDIKTYRKEMESITKDRNHFYELLGFCTRCGISSELLETKLIKFLTESNDRLTAEKIKSEWKLTYIAHPTEYRPAACRILVRIIWNCLRELFEKDVKNIDDLSNKIRAYIIQRISKSVYKTYFI